VKKVNSHKKGESEKLSIFEDFGWGWINNRERFG